MSLTAEREPIDLSILTCRRPEHPSTGSPGSCRRATPWSELAAAGSPPSSALRWNCRKGRRFADCLEERQARQRDRANAETTTAGHGEASGQDEHGPLVAGHQSPDSFGQQPARPEPSVEAGKGRSRYRRPRPTAKSFQPAGQPKRSWGARISLTSPSGPSRWRPTRRRCWPPPTPTFVEVCPCGLPVQLKLDGPARDLRDGAGDSRNSRPG